MSWLLKPRRWSDARGSLFFFSAPSQAGAVSALREQLFLEVLIALVVIGVLFHALLVLAYGSLFLLLFDPPLVAV